MICRIAVALLSACVTSVVLAPVARAGQRVTYEVVSSHIGAANIEYFDGSTRRALRNEPLPWRTTVTIGNSRSLALDGAEVRADWRRSIAAAPVWQPGKWVTVRVHIGDALSCESTLDVGNATCYGSTPFKS